MKKLFSIICTCLLFALVGCAAKPEIRYVPKIETNTIVLEPPSVLYASVKQIKPPNIKNYSTASWGEKEKMLFEYINKLDTQIESFIIDRSSISKWTMLQKKNLETAEKQ